ncbi:hypothetical protein GGP44_000569 [Salinibacter ruber]|nr:hypothetical protein [Salinibacter ruber]
MQMCTYQRIRINPAPEALFYNQNSFFHVAMAFKSILTLYNTNAG